jgi:hypothetical protein
LYFIIAATALASGMAPGSAFSYPFGIISIMNRMVVSPWVWTEMSGPGEPFFVKLSGVSRGVLG